MKPIFHTFLFLVFSFSAGAQFSEMLDLNPEESARLDSAMQELMYIMQLDTFRNMPEQQAKNFVFNTIRQVLPAEKATAFEEMLHLMEGNRGLDEPQSEPQEENLSFETGHPYSILRITQKQYNNLGDFELQIYRKRNTFLTQNALDAAFQQHLYTILNEEQQTRFPDYLKAIEEQKIKTQQRILELIIPGFNLDSAAILKLYYAEGERPVGLAHQAYDDQIQMRKIYRSHLTNIVSLEKLKQFDDLSAVLDKEHKQMLIERDSADWHSKYEQLKTLYAWSESTLAPVLNALQAQYTNQIPATIAGKLDSLRLMNNAFRAPEYDSSYMAFRPWQLRFETLKAEYLERFPNVGITIDKSANAGEAISTNYLPYFIQLRKSIVNGLDKNDVKSLSAKLVEIEKMQEEFMRKSKFNLPMEFYASSKPPSVAEQNRILNFLLSMPDK